MDIGLGRAVVFKSLVGSHNYNLNTETSDKDYKIFLLPSFDDLYSGKKFSKAYVGDTEDYDVHDIRELSNLFWKSNVNFLEVLFSKEIIINPALNFQVHNLLVDLFAKKNVIASMNLPCLYNACIGMYKTKSNTVLNGIGDKDLIGKYGYDTKSAMHSIRILDFLCRFYDSGFTDFEHAIRYNEDDIYSDILLTLKSGKMYFSDYLILSNELFLHVQDKYADMYKNCTSNEQTKEEIDEIVKEIIKLNIKEE